VILSLPTILPTSAQIFNYVGCSSPSSIPLLIVICCLLSYVRQAAPITGAVMLLSGTWYILGAHKHYKGPMSRPDQLKDSAVTDEEAGKGSSEMIHPVQP
jgi:hypothetical protein